MLGEMNAAFPESLTNLAFRTGVLSANARHNPAARFWRHDVATMAISKQGVP
jgi:hypothetical protein